MAVDGSLSLCDFGKAKILSKWCLQARKRDEMRLSRRGDLLHMIFQRVCVYVCV